jgi:hypothetical protein
MKNPFRRFTAVAFLLTGLFLLTSPSQTAHACTPPPGGLPNYTLTDRVNFAPIVLEAHVISVDSNLFPVTATLEVVQYFKGGGGPTTLNVTRFGDSTMCLSMVYEGDHIILFATGDAQSGQLEAFYASQFDAVTQATPENIQTVIDTVGQPPVLPDSLSTVETEELDSGGSRESNPPASFGPLEICLGLLFAPLLLSGVFIVARKSGE